MGFIIALLQRSPKCTNCDAVYTQTSFKNISFFCDFLLLQKSAFFSDDLNVLHFFKLKLT